MKFANSGRRKRHSSYSPASRTLFVVVILDVSYLKSTVNLEQAGSKNTFAAKTYNLCQTDLCRPVSDWRRLTMAHLTRPAEISGVSAGSFPETAAGNRAYCSCPQRIFNPVEYPSTNIKHFNACFLSKHLLNEQAWRKLFFIFTLLTKMLNSRFG